MQEKKWAGTVAVRVNTLYVMYDGRSTHSPVQEEKWAETVAAS